MSMTLLELVRRPLDYQKRKHDLDTDVQAEINNWTMYELLEAISDALPSAILTATEEMKAP